MLGLGGIGSAWACLRRECGNSCRGQAYRFMHMYMHMHMYVHMHMYLHVFGLCQAV